jgi:hypothetical protein
MTLRLKNYFHMTRIITEGWKLMTHWLHVPTSPLLRQSLTSNVRASSATAPRLPDAGQDGLPLLAGPWDLPGSDAIPSCVVGSSAGRQRLA